MPVWLSQDCAGPISKGLSAGVKRAQSVDMSAGAKTWRPVDKATLAGNLPSDVRTDSAKRSTAETEDSPRRSAGPKTALAQSHERGGEKGAVCGDERGGGRSAGTSSARGVSMHRWR